LDVYITEDLTQLRFKLLNYLKTKCDDRFELCHSYNSKIRMKEKGKAEGKENWCVISTPDDLFKF